MRIVFLHTDFRLYWVSRLAYLRDRLQKNGHELRVLEISGSGSLYQFSAKSKEESDYWQCLFPDLGMQDIASGQAVAAVLRALDELKPDIVFAGAVAYSSGAAAVRWCRSRRVPVVIFDDARQRNVRKGRLVNWVKKRIMGNADGVLISAPSHRQDYLDWGIPDSRIFYGISVVDNAFWQQLVPAADKLEGLRRELELPNRFLLGCGRQIPAKNWRRLLEAYAGSEARQHGLSLVLVGNGPDRDSLLDFVQREKLQDFIFFRDFLNPPELAVYYALSEAVVLPSVSETWGMTVHEALACGRPVLVSRACGCFDTLLQEGRTGLGFSPESVEEMTGALNRWLSLSETAKSSMDGAAREMAEKWGLERFSAGVLAAVSQLGGRRAPGFRTLLDRLLIALWNGRYRPV